MKTRGRLLVHLVQQGVWAQEAGSMPLACGYLKAILDQDTTTKSMCKTTIYNFGGTATAQLIIRKLLEQGVPDIVGFSVFGWNYHLFANVSETLKQISPRVLIVFGGPHVANHAARLFRLYPWVDIVVNGEGEHTFRDIVHARLGDDTHQAFREVRGISFHQGSRVATTPDRDRIANLDDIPSPILTGSIDFIDHDGRFIYDVAIMETNRGCPYKCSFCYWGGAIGQRARSFSRERLRAELEVLAKLRVETIALCDANFGMFREDAQFVEDLLDIKATYGYPRSLETSWAKNKSANFRSIVSLMRAGGLRSSFTIALQSLDDTALTLMNRRNMPLNNWRSLLTG